MTKALFRIALVVIVAFSLTGASCKRSSPTTAKKVYTKLEYAKEKLGPILTPHGEIDLRSMKETDDGVEYRTADGKSWRVVMEPTPNGGYRFGEPKRID